LPTACKAILASDSIPASSIAEILSSLELLHRQKPASKDVIPLSKFFFSNKIKAPPQAQVAWLASLPARKHVIDRSEQKPHRTHTTCIDDSLYAKHALVQTLSHFHMEQNRRTCSTAGGFGSGSTSRQTELDTHPTSAASDLEAFHRQEATNKTRHFSSTHELL
jgi:hypothetical protein